MIDLLLEKDPETARAFLRELQDPSLRNQEEVNKDPLWHHFWIEITGTIMSGVDSMRPKDRYDNFLHDLPAILLKRDYRGIIVKQFYFDNHPYAPIYAMPEDLRPTGKGTAFVSIDVFSLSKEEGSVAHGMMTSEVAVGQELGIAPDARLYELHADVGKSETLSQILAKNLKKVIELKKKDPSIAVVGMSFGLDVPRSFREEAEKSPVFQEIRGYAETLHEMGVLLVASSGNDSSEDLFNIVGFLPHVQLIGAADSHLTMARNDDFRSPYSTGSEKNQSVHFWAHADPSLLPSEKGGLQWSWRSGTSFSQPNFSGVVLLMKEVNPTLSVEDCLKILNETKDRGMNTSYPIETIDPMDALAWAAKLPGSTYQGERLKAFLEKLGE